MNKYFKLIVFVIVSFCYMESIECQTNRHFTVKLSDPLKPGKLDIELFNGSIKVIGYSGKEILISSTGPFYSNTNQQNVQSGDNSFVKDTSTMLDISQKKNVVKIAIEKPRVMNLVVKVPEKCSVVLKILTAGGILVENVNGDHEISMVSGNITMSAISGSVLANTKNGNITVNLTSMKPGTPLAFSNVGGIIDVSFPVSLKANAKFQTEFGEIHSDFDIVKESSSVQSSPINHKKVVGAINGGGPEILIKTVGGNIFVRKKG